MCPPFLGSPATASCPMSFLGRSECGAETVFLRVGVRWREPPTLLRQKTNECGLTGKGHSCLGEQNEWRKHRVSMCTHTHAHAQCEREHGWMEIEFGVDV